MRKGIVKPPGEIVAIEKVEHSSRSVEEKFQRLADIADTCTMCDLCHNRTHAVFGEGNTQATAMIVGEGPGVTEDRTAGRHLDRVMVKVGLDRQDFYITNIVKCHHRRIPVKRITRHFHPHHQNTRNAHGYEIQRH